MILIKLKLTTKENLTGINDAMIQYDKGIKLAGLYEIIFTKDTNYL